MKIIITLISIYFSLFIKTTEKEQISPAPTPPTPSTRGGRLSVFLGPDSTVINKYAAVTEICDNGNIVVDNAAEFKAGDKILIYQTQGAVIDTTNSANFGKILNYDNAGNYEMGFISSITGNSIRLRDTLLRGYDVAGKVQIVNIPVYANFNAKNLSCKPWDGTTGGILIFEAETVTLEGAIDVSGKGFRGGTSRISGIPCGAVDYKYPTGSSLGAFKGEGIAIAKSSFSSGRGSIGNGGGGGNANNAGGAGGSNIGFGGTGGNQILGCTNTNTTGGVGGNALQYTSAINKIFMGGGGGAGHGDNDYATAGGNGGGIIIINAQRINGNKQIIRSNGVKAANGRVTPFTDGQGGGGAGGTIFLNTPQDSISVALELKGGDGGTVLRNTVGVHGPGGGGSGGALLLKNTTATNFTSLNLISGRYGIYTNTNTPHGASSGDNGRTVTGFIPPQSAVNYKALTIDKIEKTPLCDGTESIKIVVSGSQQPFEYSINNGQSYQALNTFQALSAGTYNIKIRRNSCISKDTIIKLTPFKSDTVRRDSVVCYPSVATTLRYNFKKINSCDSIVYVTTKVSFNDTIRTNIVTCDKNNVGKIDTLRLRNFKGCDSLIIRKMQYSGSDTTVSLTICEGDNSRNRAYSKTGVYKEVYKNSKGCDSTVTLNVTVLDSSMTQQDYLLCKGDTLKIGNRRISTEGTYRDTLKNYLNCDSIVVLKVQYDAKCRVCEPFIPNAFSPNGDGNNDIFEVHNNNSTISEMLIYNRWGILMFSQQSEKPQWDGTFQGKQLNPDIYIYMIRATCKSSGRSVIWKGDVSLMR